MGRSRHGMSVGLGNVLNGVAEDFGDLGDRHAMCRQQGKPVPLDLPAGVIPQACSDRCQADSLKWSRQIACLLVLVNNRWKVLCGPSPSPRTPHHPNQRTPRPAANQPEALMPRSRSMSPHGADARFRAPGFESTYRCQ